MGRWMEIIMERFDICLVNFVFKEDKTKSKYRPALVLKKDATLQLAQITSHPPREKSDYQIKDLYESGLDKNSVVRLNIRMSALPKDLTYIGHLSDKDIYSIEKILSDVFNESLSEAAANSNGIYSLTKGWLKEPVRNKIPDNINLEPELTE
jgi:mRNA-degrading endonuclease toxin of MazEF toxin-antitoxin module